VPTLDRQGLREEFNMADEEILEGEPVDDEFELEWEKEGDDPKVLRANVDKANDLLDKILLEINAGNFSARMVEVAGQIINSITQASKVLMDDKNYNKYLDIRKALVLLKKKEVEIKQLRGPRPTNQYNIISTREDVLKMLKDKEYKNEPDSENEPEITN
jgi:hypothetical protein